MQHLARPVSMFQGGQLPGGLAGIAGGEGQVDQVAARIDGRQALADEEDRGCPDDMGPVRVVFHPHFGYFQGKMGSLSPFFPKKRLVGRGWYFFFSILSRYTQL